MQCNTSLPFSFMSPPNSIALSLLILELHVEMSSFLSIRHNEVEGSIKNILVGFLFNNNISTTVKDLRGLLSVPSEA